MLKSMVLRTLALGLLVVGLVLLPRVLGRTPEPPLKSPEVPADAVPATVDRVVDGDTIWVKFRESAEPQKVRILEIDSPELNVESGKPECGAVEARDFAREELPFGSTVYLLPDREDRDQYGRLLRYVWDADGEFYDEKAVSLGHARTILIPPNDHYIVPLRAAEATARQDGRGIWGKCPI